MISDHEKATDVMRAAFKEVKEGMSLGGLQMMHDLFGAMANVYVLELMSCTAEDLAGKQAALRQCMRLQQAMLPHGELPKV